MSFLTKIQSSYKIQSEYSEYYTSQINKIINSAKNSEYAPQMQIKHEGMATKWLNVKIQNLEDLIKSIDKTEKQ